MQACCVVRNVVGRGRRSGRGLGRHVGDIAGDMPLAVTPGPRWLVHGGARGAILGREGRYQRGRIGELS